jgi:transposase-like protein
MAKGRQPNTRGEAYWRRIVRQQAVSGVTIRDFCRKSKLRESAFYFWRKELLRPDAASKRQRDHVRPPAQAAFVPVCVTAEAVEPAAQEDTAGIQAGRIEIVLAGGRRIHVAPPVDRQALADVLAVLAAALERQEVRPC